MNDHLHPVFAGILNAAASRPDATPAGQVPTPKPLMLDGFPYTACEQVKPRMRTFMCRSGQGDGIGVCVFCGIHHENEHANGLPSRYCDDRCAQLDNL